jgi:methylaspartate ammonia-lyase
MSEIKTRMLDALKTKYQGDYKSAHATLEIYLNNPVGIGEHPQHLEEMDKIIEQMASAQDKIDIINKEYAGESETLLG